MTRIASLHIRSLALRTSGKFSVSALVLACMLSLPVQAQAQGDAEAESTATAADIIVTGSRIVRRDMVSNTPIVTLQQDAIVNTAGATLETKLLQLPQFAGSANSQFGGVGSSAGAATLNLRNLGDFRNLVLLDGRRLQPSTSTFAIDVNTIPSIVIDNVEVISGGASAVYGSDAMSGVVNFKVKRRFDGFQLDSQISFTEHGGAGTKNISGIFGTDFAEGRGNIFIAADYTNREPVLNSQREFYRKAARLGSSALGQLSFLDYGYLVPDRLNLPSQAAVNMYFSSFGAAAGAVQNSANIAFNNDLTLFNQSGRDIYNYKGQLGEVDAIIARGPEKALVQSSRYPLFSGAGLDRFSLFGNTEYKVSDRITTYFQGIFTSYRSTTTAPYGSAANQWTRTIARDAAHPVPDDVAFILDSRPNPMAPFQVASSTSFAWHSEYTHDNDIFQVLGGLRGDLGANITWDLYGSHGRTQIIDRQGKGAVSFDRLQEVQAAPNYGAGICAGGISPFGQLNAADPSGNFLNVAGHNPNPSAAQLVSAECLEYVTVRPINQTIQKQDIVELNLQGKIADLPAGELRFAAGASYRRNSYEFNPDAAYKPLAGGQSDVIGLFGQLPTIGATSVKEAYGEVLVPVLSDLPFVKSLSFDAAFRYSDYNTSGGVEAYKIDADWQVSDLIRFRGGYQRAVRAPNVVELFGAAQTVFSLNAPDPCSVQSGLPFGNTAANTNRNKAIALCQALIGPGADTIDFQTYTGLNLPVQVGQLTGNPGLRPETADTFTVGLVLTPRFGETRISLSVDYYDIKIEGAIAALSAGDKYNACFNGIGNSNPDYDPANPFCAGIMRAPAAGNGVPLSVQIGPQNQGGIQTRGVDAQLDLSTPVGPGRLGLNVVANYLDSFKQSLASGFPFIEYAGTTGGYFRWKTFTTLSYKLEQVGIGVRHRFLSSVRDATTATNAASVTPGVPAYHLFDAFANFTVNGTFSFRLGVDNIFDKEPPAVAGIPGNVDPQNYDILGRRFYVGASLKF